MCSVCAVHLAAVRYRRSHESRRQAFAPAPRAGSLKWADAITVNIQRGNNNQLGQAGTFVVIFCFTKR